MKTSLNVFYMEFVHIQDVAKKMTRVLEIVCLTDEDGPKRTFFAKTRLQTLLARRPTPGGVVH
jgi:hypothetical protein